jgi:arylsulfatase A-like enzyme
MAHCRRTIDWWFIVKEILQRAPRTGRPPVVRRAALVFVLAASLLPSLVATQPRPGARPNVIFIMTDDHAAHAIGAYGSRVNTTPHLDRLAREGALLANVFATNAICTPSRAAILTGQYAHINGVTMFNRFDSSRTTVARLLQQSGYHTGMVGKWHLGSDPVGFDRWEILPGQGAYFDPILYTSTGERTYTGRYATDVITDLAIGFMESRPRDRPFFLMMHHKAPHRPWEPSARDAATFAERRIPEPPTFWDGYQTRSDALRQNQQRVADDMTNRDLKLPPPPGLSADELVRWRTTRPESVTIERGGASVTLTGQALARWKYQRYMQDYLATVQSVDDSVGRVLAFLDEAGLARDTIVVYTSDQGFFLGDHGLYDKRFMYEESIRMPFLVRWPAGIEPAATQSASTWTSPPRSSTLRGSPCPRRCRAAVCSPRFVAVRRRTGGRRCITATTTTPAITTPGRTTASGRARTS